MDHYKLCISYPPGKPVTREQLYCYLRQLAKDLCRDKPRIIWTQSVEPSKEETFFTHGLSDGKSQIILDACFWNGCLHFTMCYTKDGKIIFQAQETNGDHNDPNHIIHLYLKVKAALCPSHNGSNDLNKIIYTIGDLPI